MKDKLKVLKLIKENTEKDMETIDGIDFTGKNVGTQLGYQAAAIVALCDIIETLIKGK